ncbi:MAG: hypothetical protein WCJ35_25810 [Planctomycetota bacterium]
MPLVRSTTSCHGIVGKDKPYNPLSPLAVGKVMIKATGIDSKSYCIATAFCRSGSTTPASRSETMT